MISSFSTNLLAVFNGLLVLSLGYLTFTFLRSLRNQSSLGLFPFKGLVKLSLNVLVLTTSLLFGYSLVTTREQVISVATYEAKIQECKTKVSQISEDEDEDDEEDEEIARFKIYTC